MTVTTSDTTLLDNDWDPEGSPLTASVVNNPSDGTVSNFTGTAGTFTYTPDTGFKGLDRFTYKVSDGTVDSPVVAVSIAVGGDFGARTNQEELPQAGLHLTGGLQLTQELTPGLQLIYNSATHPEPIVVLETFLQDDESVPDEIKAKLTFNGTVGTDYSYSTTGLSAGDSLRFALQHDASSLSTGRYDYTVRLTSKHTSSTETRDYSGSQVVVNRGGGSHAFGRGWHLAGLDRLYSETGGMLLVGSDGSALWFSDDGSGGYDAVEGDLSFSALVKNQDNSFTLTDKHGIETNFDSSGYLTSREDRNGNTVTFTYTSGLLTKITDPNNRDTTLTYTSGRLTSVSDFASRSATLTYDANGRLTKVTQPDPDGTPHTTRPAMPTTGWGE